MIDRDMPHSCNKRCIANVDGQCAVKACGGPISRLVMPDLDLEKAAWTYRIARDTFDELFGTEVDE